MTIGSHDSGDRTDGELLRRFTHLRDEAAFTALLRRHGPMVLGVCRRVLRDPNDAEDAFQATFLVLVRKAPSLARPDSLANWLYGVAHRTALEAKTQAARRRAKERQVVPMPQPDRAPDVVWADLRPVLDEEVARLPDKYRAAFVLCQLEGRTNEEAARLLGCPKGTILSRLSWARERLRWRLTRRGLALPAGLFAGLLSLGEVSAAVPPSLLVATANTATAAAAGQAIVSTQVATLTEGVLRAMWFTKLKAFASVIVAVAVLGAAGLFTYPSLGAEGEGAKKGKSDREKLQGVWVLVSADHGGKKIEGEDARGCTLTIKGDKMTLKIKGMTMEAAVKLAPDKKPKQIDMTVNEGVGDELHKGIYKLDGDTFTLCASHPPQERPSEFATKEGERWPALFVFQRQKK